MRKNQNRFRSRRGGCCRPSSTRVERAVCAGRVTTMPRYPRSAALLSVSQMLILAMMAMVPLPAAAATADGGGRRGFHTTVPQGVLLGDDGTRGDHKHTRCAAAQKLKNPELAAAAAAMAQGWLASRYRSGAVAAAAAASSGSVVEITTYFHVVQNSSLNPAGEQFGFVPEPYIVKQVAAANAVLEPLGFRLLLAGVSYYTNNTWWLDSDITFSPLVRLGTYDKLNVVVSGIGATPSDIWGFAYPPFPQPAAVSDSSFDSNFVKQDIVMLSWWYFVEGVTSGWSVKDFETFMHEIGHWLGLRHTFEDMIGTYRHSCQGGSDFIEDTPAQAFPSFRRGCANQDSCGGPLYPGAEVGGGEANFMDYARQCRSYRFTPGQVEFMHANWAMFRSPTRMLLESTSCYMRPQQHPAVASDNGAGAWTTCKVPMKLGESCTVSCGPHRAGTATAVCAGLGAGDVSTVSPSYESRGEWNYMRACGGIPNVAPPTSCLVRDVAAGYYASAALLDNGAVATWGAQLGTLLGHAWYEAPKRAIAEQVVALTLPAEVTPAGIQKIFAGHAENFGLLTTDGRVVVWGSNDDGLASADGSTGLPRILSVSGMWPAQASPVAQLALGGKHALALLEDGSVMSLGSNEAGQLGSGSTTSRAVLGMVTLPARAHSVAAGELASAVLLEDGTLYTFGSNMAGQLGNGDALVDGFTSFIEPSPVQATGLPAGSRLQSIAAAAATLCALLLESGASENSVWCAGSNESSERGTTATIPEYSAAWTKVDGLSDVVQLVAGSQHFCARTARAPRPLCWGANRFGQAAWNTDGTAQGGDQQSTPLLVDAGFNNANTVSAGAATTCIRNTSGVALCSGAAPLRGNEAVPPGVALPLACEWAAGCGSEPPIVEVSLQAGQRIMCVSNNDTVTARFRYAITPGPGATPPSSTAWMLEPEVSATFPLSSCFARPTSTGNAAARASGTLAMQCRGAFTSGDSLPPSITVTLKLATNLPGCMRGTATSTASFALRQC